MSTELLRVANFPRPTQRFPALDLLRRGGFTVEQIGRDEFRVNGMFKFWPATNFWRSETTAQHGYMLRTLMVAARANEVTA